MAEEEVDAALGLEQVEVAGGAGVDDGVQHRALTQSPRRHQQRRVVVNDDV